MPKAADSVLDRVTRRGVKLSRRGFTLYYLRLLNPPTPRIVISSKIDKRATVRNRLRRQIRSILKAATPHHRAIVVIVRRELLGLTFAELRSEFDKVLTLVK